MGREHLLQLALRVDASRADEPFDQTASRSTGAGRDVDGRLR
jgi:hypothetical protein